MTDSAEPPPIRGGSPGVRAGLIPRHAAAAVREALRDTPVVLLNGPRQAGKSTLAQVVLAEIPGARAFTLDDAATRAAARADPVGFVETSSTMLIDEIQRAPELFLAIKASVDRDRRPGRFLLTGSAGVLTLPRLADALVGRMEVVELWPFSQGEIRGRKERFIDALFGRSRALRSIRSDLTKRAYLEAAAVGGYPEAVLRRSPARRERWFASIVATTIARDVKELADIDRLDELPRLLRLVAARSARLLNVAGLARDARVPEATMRRYLTLLEAAFLVRLHPVWSSSRTTRIVKAPKILMTDSGLTSHLLGLDLEGLADPLGEAGPILEAFVAAELRRQLGWARTRATMHHYRDRDGVEVDIVLERADGRVCGIEVKSGATVGDSDFRGLRLLERRLGDRFVCGVALYAGAESLSFGSRLLALPIESLWAITEAPRS